MYICEIANEDIVGVHSTPLGLAEWRPSQSSVTQIFAIGGDTFQLLFGRILEYVYVNGAFVERVRVTASPSTAAVDTTVTVTATLPADTQDTQATFQVEGGSAISEDVVDGQASHAYVFVSPGTYQINVSSVNHGRAVVEVVVV